MFALFSRWVRVRCHRHKDRLLPRIFIALSIKTHRRVSHILAIAICIVLGYFVIDYMTNDCSPFWRFTGNTHPIDLTNRPPYETFDVHINHPQKRNRIILLWTAFFGITNWNTVLDEYQCKSCIVTSDRRLLFIADVVVFHCRDFHWYSFWPAFVSFKQIYTIICHESPVHSSMYQFYNRMNLTVTYRLDSDVILGFHTVPKPIQSYIPHVPLHKKTKMAVWPVSHCQTPSKRELYVEELGKHLDIDIYGSCGPNKCSRSQQKQCMQAFENNYKFYLAFENSVCHDYVTEKLAEPLQYDIIPVVFGGADYTRLAPPHSVIDARDFNSPANLAAFLLSVARNETAYNEYFAWKGQANFSWNGNYWCRICHIASHADFHKEYPHLGSWWNKDQCDNSVVHKYLV